MKSSGFPDRAILTVSAWSGVPVRLSTVRIRPDFSVMVSCSPVMKSWRSNAMTSEERTVLSSSIISRIPDAVSSETMKIFFSYPILSPQTMEKLWSVPLPEDKISVSGWTMVLSSILCEWSSAFTRYIFSVYPAISFFPVLEICHEKSIFSPAVPEAETASSDNPAFASRLTERRNWLSSAISV